MLVKEIITEKEDRSVKLADNIINLLKKTPKAEKAGSKGQFKNDPNKIHASARAKFREWCRMQGLKYVGPNIMNRGGSRIRFYTFIGLMQRECGIPVTGVFDVSTMRGFAQNANRFSDSYISARVEQAISKSKFKVPRGCIDVVKAIENPVNAWTSAYASYHDVNGNLDSGIGPGQVEPGTYGDVKGGSFDFGKFEHVTSLDKLTDLMLEGIQLKMKFADVIAKKEDSEITTLEHFARAWNYVHYKKAQSVYGLDTPMRMTSSPKPKLRPDTDKPELPKPKPDIKTKTVPKMDNPENPKQEPGYFDRLKSGIGNMVRGYFDSEG